MPLTRPSFRPRIARLTVALALAAATTRRGETQVPAPPMTAESVTGWLDAYLPGALRRGDIAGAVVSVVQNGAVVAERGYGFADLARRTPMDPRTTIIRAASLSKSFSATAVMQLVEQGKLDLDRDVNDYLDFSIPAAFGKAITLRHLLTHSAGFEEISYKRHDPPMTLREHVADVPERIYPPGEVTAYSNYGLALAGYIVARTSGEPFVDYIQRHIFSPLGMERSTFLLPLPAKDQPFEARYYERASSAREFPPSDISAMSPVEAPAAGLATTAHDMTSFMLSHLGESKGAPLMGGMTLAQMHAPAFTPIHGVQPVALGLFHGMVRGYRFVGHSGDGDGTHAEMWLFPEQRLGVFIAFNSDGMPSDFLPAAFSARAALISDFVAHFLPPRPAPDEATVSTAQAHATIAAGEYAWSRQQRGDYQELLGLVQRFALGIRITANADGTITTPPGLTFESAGKTQRWREVGDFIWRDVEGDAHLVMDVRDSQVRAVWTDQEPPYWVDLRVPALYSAGLNVPLLIAASLVVMIATVAWPVRAAIRRRRSVRAEPRLESARAERFANVGMMLGALYMIGWIGALGADFPSRVGVEAWIRLIQAVGVTCIAGAIAAWWRAWTVSKGSSSAAAKLWHVVGALALSYLVWFSFAFHLISRRID